MWQDILGITVLLAFLQGQGWNSGRTMTFTIMEHDITVVCVKTHTKSTNICPTDRLDG